MTCWIIAWRVFFIHFAVSPLVSLLHNSPWSSSRNHSCSRFTSSSSLARFAPRSPWSCALGRSSLEVTSNLCWSVSFTITLNVCRTAFFTATLNLCRSALFTNTLNFCRSYSSPSPWIRALGWSSFEHSSSASLGRYSSRSHLICAGLFSSQPRWIGALDQSQSSEQTIHPDFGPLHPPTIFVLAHRLPRPCVFTRNHHRLRFQTTPLAA